MAHGSGGQARTLAMGWTPLVLVIRGTRVMARTVNDPLQRVSFGARAAQPDLAAVVDELGVQVTDGLQTGLGHTYDT